MRKRGYGRIVNIASIAGKEGNPFMAPYSATKAAVIGLTKSLGKEVATEGICVNAVAPAVVQTKILEQLTTDQVDYMTQRIPMRRCSALLIKPGLLVCNGSVLRRERRQSYVLSSHGIFLQRSGPLYHEERRQRSSFACASSSSRP